MTACDSAALSQYLDSELPPRERLGLEKHLRGCATCRQELAVLRRMDQVIVDWGARNVPVPSVTESRIQESVNRRRSLGPLVSVSRMMPAAVGSCAAALLLLVSANIGWLYQSGGSVAQSDTSAHVQRIIESNSKPLQNARRMAAILGSRTEAPSSGPLQRFRWHLEVE